MTASELTRVLLAMPARSAQVLRHRFLEGRTREQCAELYAIEPAAFDVLLLRAWRDFEGKSSPQPFAEEQRDAAALREGLPQALIELQRQGDEVRRLLAEAE